MMTRMQVYLPKEMFVDLKQTALTKGVTMSNLIKDGLTKILYPDRDKSFDPMTDFVGKGKTAKQTNAVKDIKNYYKSI